MKKTRILLLIFVLIASCLIVSCGDGEKTESLTVTFYDDDGSIINQVEVTEGDTVATPINPTKKNHNFLGWYTDSPSGARYDFSKKVYRNLSLFAKYELDGVGITNEISRNIMQSVVKIRVRSYSDILFGWIETESSGWNSGSGFCFDADNGRYYILTNCHVAVKKEGYEKQEIQIIDYKGNTYTGHLYGNAIDPTYDLACLYFDASSTEVKPLSIVNENPQLSEDVILLGTPDSQANTITFGKSREYIAITLDDCEAYRSNVTFPVLRHDAGTAAGSSGGPLLNSDLKVVGVNYAGQSGGGTRAYAIPAEKIWEFLKKYYYK